MADWVTTTALLPHQEAAVAKLLPTRAGALFMDMGTGKSRTLLELARIRQGKYDRLIWACPCSGRETIRQEILKHTTLTDADIYVFDDSTETRNLPLDRRIYVLGIESLSSSARVVFAFARLVTDHSFLAIDESHLIKGHRANRTQRLTGIGARARYRSVLTGTPFSQGAQDLFSQMTFLSPKILGYNSFYSFARNHLEYEVRKDAQGHRRRTGRIIRCHNEEYLASKMAPYVYQVRKDECLTLPEKLYETRYCCMTAAQRHCYEWAKQEILLDLDYDSWNPIAIFHLFSTLQSIVCGFWNRQVPGAERREPLEIASERPALLLHVIAGIPDAEKVIIWAKYHHAVEQIKAALITEHGADSVAELHGWLTDRQRNEHLAAWRAGRRFLVATQDTGAQVLTLNEAAYAIFYADSFKYVTRAQAEDRNHRIGQSRRPVYITLHCEDSIDSRIASALARKENTLAVFQSQIDKYRREGMKQRAIDLVRSL